MVAHKIFSVSPSPLLGSLGLELGLDWGLEGWGLGLDNIYIYVEKQYGLYKTIICVKLFTRKWPLHVDKWTIEDLIVTDNLRMSREEDYTNITIFINGKRKIFLFNVWELINVNFNLEISLYNLILPITCAVTVLLVNFLVLLMLKMKEKTLVDKMVLLDCLANISTVGVMFLAFPIRVWGKSDLCLLITFFRGFVFVLNRLSTHFMLTLKEGKEIILFLHALSG